MVNAISRDLEEACDESVLTQMNLETIEIAFFGGSFTGIAACREPEDKLIQKACELYCKWQFDFDGKGERFERAYEGLRDFLSLGGEYTNEVTQ